MGVDSELACGIVEGIGQLWLDGQFVDLKIHVDNIPFNCNQFILCACSKFFNVLLGSEVKCKGGRLIRKVTIKGIAPEIFQLVLMAVHRGENGITPDNMIEVWHAAHQLQIPVLVSKCKTVVSSHLSQENFVNIYKTALLLQSVNVIKAAHQFVAENFESFKDCEILLQQPASFIEDIIGSGSLVGQSQNHVVEFILKWVNYGLCARESEHVWAESVTEDMSTWTNKVTVNKIGSIEVTLQKPDEIVYESRITGLPGPSLARIQSVGKLLKRVKFAELSKESMALLTNNNQMMDSKEIRDIIIQAKELVNSDRTSAASAETEETVVFVSKVNPKTIYAYSLERGAIFTFLRRYYIGNIHTHQHRLLCIERNYANSEPYVLKIFEFPYSRRIREISFVGGNTVIAGDFCYTIRTHVYRKKINESDWHQLFTPAGFMSGLSLSLVVFKDSVLYYNSLRHQRAHQTIFCYHTVTGQHWPMLVCTYEDCHFVTFVHDDKLYLLYGNGVFVEVTDWTFSPHGIFYLPSYSDISRNSVLWDFQFQIYGAVVYRQSLVVFCSLNSVLVSDVHNCRIPGLTTIKFVHLCELHTRCYPLVIPKHLLTR